MSNKTIRVRTKPGGDDNYIRVKLDQDFNQLQILSLSIDQEDLYRSFNANYGVVAGRIDINNGFGLKNAKVSIFIPLSSEDQENEIISQLYPYKSLDDLNSNGVRYNLLPRKQQHIDHTPTGTFPDKRQVLDNPTMVEVYDKYYKFTTTTNEAGDYMFFGVPVGSQQVFIDVDVSDIGFLSVRPYELISQGIPEEKFESKFKFKSSDKLDELPQVISTSSSVEVLPFWSDDLTEDIEFGITRFDYSVTQYTLTPTAMFMGSMFSDNENDSLSKNCRPRKKMGEMNDLITGAGKIEAITRTKDGEIVLSKDVPEDAVDENGNWAIQLPMTMRKLVTDEFGALIPSPDGKRGVASEADYRFRISMEPNKDDKKKRTRSKMLVPNMTNNYKFGEFSKIDLKNAEAAGEPLFKINEQLSYKSSNGPLNQYNYLEDFFTFRWKKVYTVRQYIPRYQPNKRDKNKNFIGFKEILDGAGVNKLPFNRIFAKVNVLYTIICVILHIFGFIVAFVNSIIQFVNALISRICQIRIPLPCISGGLGECETGTKCNDSDRKCGAGTTPLFGFCFRFLCGIKVDFVNARVTREYNKFSLKACLRDVCIVKGLCNTCSNDDDYPTGGVNEKCCSGCKDCTNNNLPECKDNCLKDCCEKIKPISLKCAEEDKIYTPIIFESNYSDGVRKCGGEKLTICYSCGGTSTYPISNWVACKLEALATKLGMLDFEFYNDWMNGSLYFPLIKRKLKIKRAKKAAKGKTLKRGQGQIKKDSFCDYDCDGGNNEPDYQHPDDVYLYSVKLRGGGKQEFTFEGCKVNLPRRISAKQWYEDVDQVYKTIEFKGNQVDDITKACTFTLSDYCSVNTCNDGVELNGTTKKLIIKTKKVPGEHGKPKYIKIGAGTDGDGKKISVWENVGGHGHQRNKCKKNFLLEKEEYTKIDLSDCVPLKESNDNDNSLTFTSDNIIKGGPDNKECALACKSQGTAACANRDDCNDCDADGYNEDATYRGLVKWEEGEIYYSSIIDENDKNEDGKGRGNFNQTHYKKNMLFPTNITELGSSVFCDIDEAPFIVDNLEPTTFRVSEEELSIKSGVGTESEPYKLKEKEGNINLRAYVDFGCSNVKCMNVRSSLTEAQVGTELFDLNDNGLECDTCKAYVDVDTEVRQYFCQRFSTFVPKTNGNVITNMEVNYIRPGGSQGENYYEPYNVVTGSCGTFNNDYAETEDGTKIVIDTEINDGDAITPGDKCGYLTTGTTGSLDFQNVKYFYGMDLSSDHEKKNLKNYPFEESKLGSDYIGGIDVEQNPILVNDDEGISPFTTQTPYFFYFGLVPGKTALNKVVGKFFADKINAETLETISNGGTNETNVPPNSEKITSPQSIVGSCINS